VLVGKFDGKRQFERHVRRWENNVKMDLREIGWDVWSGFIWLGIGTSPRESVTNEPLGSIKSGEFSTC
jgi:hypothetical protein